MIPFLTNTSVEEIREISKVRDFTKRLIILGYPNTPPDVLDRFSRSVDEIIRYRVAEHKNISEKTLKRLLLAEYEYIRECASESKNMPPKLKEMYEKFLFQSEMEK